jgi:hypothetical protein
VVQPALLGPQDQQAYRDHKVTLVVLQVLLVVWVQQVRQAHAVPLDLLVFRELQDLQVHKVTLVEPLELQVRQGPLVLQEPLVYKV